MKVERTPLDLGAVPAPEPRRALKRDVAERSYVVAPHDDAGRGARRVRHDRDDSRRPGKRQKRDTSRRADGSCCVTDVHHSPNLLARRDLGGKLPLTVRNSPKSEAAAGFGEKFTGPVARLRLGRAAGALIPAGPAQARFDRRGYAIEGSVRTLMRVGRVASRPRSRAGRSSAGVRTRIPSAPRADATTS